MNQCTAESRSDSSEADTSSSIMDVSSKATYLQVSRSQWIEPSWRRSRRSLFALTDRMWNSLSSRPADPGLKPPGAEDEGCPSSLVSARQPVTVRHTQSGYQLSLDLSGQGQKTLKLDFCCFLVTAWILFSLFGGHFERLWSHFNFVGHAL